MRDSTKIIIILFLFTLFGIRLLFSFSFAYFFQLAIAKDLSSFTCKWMKMLKWMPEQKNAHTKIKKKKERNNCTPTKEPKRRINNKEQYSMPRYYVAHMKSWNAKTFYSIGTFDGTISSVIHIRLEYFIYFVMLKKVMLESMKNGLCLLGSSLLYRKGNLWRCALLTEITMIKPQI